MFTGCRPLNVGFGRQSGLCRWPPLRLLLTQNGHLPIPFNQSPPLLINCIKMDTPFTIFVAERATAIFDTVAHIRSRNHAATIDF